MSGTKKDSQPKSLSTGGPPEFETPQEIEDYTSDLPGLIKSQEPTAQPPKVTSIEAPSVKAVLEEQLVTMTQQGATIPRIRVVDDNGRETVGELDVGLVNMVVSLGQLGQLAKVRKALERDHFRGKLDPRELPVTDEYQFIDLVNDWPNTPWIGFFIINHGPNTAKVQINGIHETWLKIRKSETRTVDRSKADERISLIAYQCDPGETALLEIEGEY